jgi:CheY-like chemotaxis protein
MSERPILVVDDSDLLRDALTGLLEAEGYDVVVAANGEEAMEHLGAGLEPGLIVLDLVMPRKNGLQFRSEQLRDPRLASIPTVACSSDRRLRMRAESLGMAFVEKPDIDGVLAAVGRHCTPYRRMAAGAGA